MLDLILSCNNNMCFVIKKLQAEIGDEMYGA